jgi:hypothetical protein
MPIKGALGRSLAKYSPRLAGEWHHLLNKLSPSDVSPGSGKRVWWICSVNRDHVWIATICNRARLGSGCPYCAHLKVSPATSLANAQPAVAAEWHPTKNGRLRPADVVSGSRTRVWWKCAEGPDHEWQCEVGDRKGCPYCTNRKVSVTNCLATRFPAVADEWYGPLNGGLTPRDVLATATKRFWFQCTSGHVWKTKIRQRTVFESGCPVCRYEQTRGPNYWKRRRRRPPRLTEGGGTRASSARPGKVADSLSVSASRNVRKQIGKPPGGTRRRGSPLG